MVVLLPYRRPFRAFVLAERKGLSSHRSREVSGETTAAGSTADDDTTDAPDRAANPSPWSSAPPTEVPSTSGRPLPRFASVEAPRAAITGTRRGAAESHPDGLFAASVSSPLDERAVRTGPFLA